MAKKKIDVFLEIHNEDEFGDVIYKNYDKLICAEIYSSFAGPCLVLDRLFQVIKLDWSNDTIVLLKVMCNQIYSLRRFWGQSEPTYMFIKGQRVTSVFRGVDQIKFAEVVKSELRLFDQADSRPTYKIDEITPLEKEFYDTLEKQKLDEFNAMSSQRAERQAARKRHRAEIIAPYLGQLNFVMFWPHAKHAHPELYQRWDDNNIIMVGREEIQLTRELALDVLYEGDAPINEASLHALLAAPALVICFRLLDTDTHFITLVRKILYQDLSPMKERSSYQPITAFDAYSSYSLSAEEIRQTRRNVKQNIKIEEDFKRARRLSEMQRLARQAQEETMKQKKHEKEIRRLEALKIGNLAVLDIEDVDEEDIIIPEDLPDAVEVSSSSEDEDEYFPPAGLLVPGFYSPPNDIAKANGLSVLFPKTVSEYVSPPPEYLPDHVLVLIHISKRQKAIKILKPFRTKYVIHLGVFRVMSLAADVVHIAYSVKQYDTLHVHKDENIKLAIMLSTVSDVPLLDLVDLIPDHISRDPESGEMECARLFKVDYGDDYDQFEDFHD